MVDTPKEGDGDGTAEDDPSKKQPKHRRQRRRSKSHQNQYGDSNTGDNNTPESAEENPIIGAQSDSIGADHGVHHRRYLSALALQQHTELTKVSLLIKRVLARL